MAETPMPNGTIDADTQVEETTAAVNGMKLSESEGTDVTPTGIDALDLPLSAKDGLITKPFAEPLDSVKPVVGAPLTSEQQSKYDALLKQVSTWTELPETSAKGAASSVMTDSERMFLTRECLLRYLRATTWSVSQAEQRLRNTLVWRREYGVEKCTPEYISIENETGKQLIMGWDIHARPCQYMRPSKQNTPRTERQIQHLVFMLERSIDLMPPGQETLALLINFAETKTGQGATLGQGKQTLNILQNHYPERLGRALVTNVPFYIWGFFKLITPFIDPLTREKIKFNEDTALHVPRAQLLQANGGDVEFEYDHSVYWPALNKLCELKRAQYQARWEKGGKRIGEREGYLRGGKEKSLAESEQSIDAQPLATREDGSA